jgi:hypothetical protein
VKFDDDSFTIQRKENCLLKKILPFLFCILGAQEGYEGQITFDYSGTVNGTFTSIVQDSILSGFAYNQMGLDTSYVVMMAITEQDENEFDLFLAILQDTTFPVQPRTWEIPGQGDAENPLSFETIVVHIPGMDSSFVVELTNLFTDTTNTWDSLDLTIILADLYTELADDLYLGLSGELEISDVSDSSFSGTFNSIMLKPTFHIPPHIVSINNGEFSFNKVELPDLSSNYDYELPNTFSILPPYPNPFNPETTLRFTIDTGTKDVSLNIFDISGRWVETLAHRAMEPGTHQIRWHAGNQPSGIYFAVLQSGVRIQSTKLILIK